MNPKPNAKILIVDDEIDITNLVEQFLHLENYETIACHSGESALQIIGEQYKDISLVLLDIMMPKISGYEVLEKIKSESKYDDILVVLFTVKNFQTDIQKAKMFKADGYLPKGISGKQLINYVDKLLKKKGNA